jgi:hypothetical protein
MRARTFRRAGLRDPQRPSRRRSGAEVERDGHEPERRLGARASARRDAQFEARLARRSVNATVATALEHALRASRAHSGARRTTTRSSGEDRSTSDAMYAGAEHPALDPDP